MTDLDRQSDRSADRLREALRRMPQPQPRPDFVDRALARATAAHAKPTRAGAPGAVLHRLLTRWETWVGAALGAAVAAALTLILLRPVADSVVDPPGIALALNEVRDIEVLIDSERDLEDATIRVAVTGSVALDGFDDEREIGWQANLERGSNLLSLPVVARSLGNGRLIATIEHQGRTRRVAIDVKVRNSEVSRS